MTDDAVLDRVFRAEWGTVVATLARRLGDLQAAEDAAQDAFAAATRRLEARRYAAESGCVAHGHRLA